MQSAPELGRLLGDLTAKDTMLLSPRDKANVLNALKRDVSPSKTAAFDADDPSEELTEEEELVRCSLNEILANLFECAYFRAKLDRSCSAS